MTADEAFQAFDGVSIVAFRDAGYLACSYKCTVLDCLRGLEFAVGMGWFNLSHFNVREYEFYSDRDHGDVHWIIPDKIMAFSSPNKTRFDSKGVKNILKAFFNFLVRIFYSRRLHSYLQKVQGRHSYQAECWYLWGGEVQEARNQPFGCNLHRWELSFRRQNKSVFKRSWKRQRSRRPLQGWSRKDRDNDRPVHNEALQDASSRFYRMDQDLQARVCPRLLVAVFKHCLAGLLFERDRLPCLCCSLWWIETANREVLGKIN